MKLNNLLFGALAAFAAATTTFTVVQAVRATQWDPYPATQLVPYPEIRHLAMPCPVQEPELASPSVGKPPVRSAGWAKYRRWGTRSNTPDAGPLLNTCLPNDPLCGMVRP